jgi:multiple sugar transport system permease protein
MSSSTAVAGTVTRAQRRHESLHRQRLWALWGSYIALAVFVVIFLVPPFYMVMTSLKNSHEIGAERGSPWYAHHPTLENFWYLITYHNFQIYYLNSVIVTICTVAISMAISVFAAFGLSRMGFKGSQTLSTGVFLTYLIPPSLLFLPLFQIVGWMGLINSFWCLVLLYPTLAVPGLIAATIFAFTVSWGSFLYPLAYLYTSSQMVLTVGIVSDLIRGDVFEWGKIMAANVLASLPPILIYAFLMDYYVAGLTAGATKG